MNTPNPEIPWWEKEPYISSVDCKYHHECEECSGEYGEYDIPEIIKEAVERERDEVYLMEHGKLRRAKES